MDKNLKALLGNFTFKEGASDVALAELVDLSLPGDYLSVFSELNGGEGFIGEEYLILWKAEELILFNKEYETEKYAPGIFLFASNGGGEGFGFDTRDNSFNVVQIPFIGMDLQYASPVADNFTQLLERMRDSHGSML